MATTNEITGDKLITKSTNDNYRDNYDRIFGKKSSPVTLQVTTGGEDAKQTNQQREETPVQD